MKILITTDSYKHNLSGVMSSVLALSSGLRQRGHEVKILSPSDRYRSYKVGNDYYIRSFPFSVYPDMRVCLVKKDPLIDELVDWKPDVIHAQTEGTTCFLAKKIQKRCDIPLVMTCHTDYGYLFFGPYRSDPILRWILKTAGKNWYAEASVMTVPSKKAAEFPWVDAFRDEIKVVPNGIKLKDFEKHLTKKERHELRDRLGVDDTAPVLLSITRLSREKNISVLISCFKLLQQDLPDAKLLIVGEGPDRAHLERITRRLGLSHSVIFAGRVPLRTVWQYYDIGDIFVSASTFEVHSMSYLEALGSGLPMLCREDEALQGVVCHGENGFIYRSKDGFLRYAKALITDSSLRKRMGERSLKKAQSFSHEAAGDSMIQVYTEAIKGYHKRGA